MASPPCCCGAAATEPVRRAPRAAPARRPNRRSSGAGGPPRRSPPARRVPVPRRCRWPPRGTRRCRRGHRHAPSPRAAAAVAMPCRRAAGATARVSTSASSAAMRPSSMPPRSSIRPKAPGSASCRVMASSPQASRGGNAAAWIAARAAACAAGRPRRSSGRRRTQARSGQPRLGRIDIERLSRQRPQLSLEPAFGHHRDVPYRSAGAHRSA